MGGRFNRFSPPLSFRIPASTHFQTIPGKQKALVPGLTSFLLCLF